MLNIMGGGSGGVHPVHPHTAEMDILQPGNPGDSVFSVKQEAIRPGYIQISSHSVCRSYGNLSVCTNQIIRIVPELILTIIPCLTGGQFIGGSHSPINIAARVVARNDDIADTIDRKAPFAGTNLRQADLFIDGGCIFCRNTV